MIRFLTCSFASNDNDAVIDGEPTSGSHMKKYLLLASLAVQVNAGCDAVPLYLFEKIFNIIKH